MPVSSQGRFEMRLTAAAQRDIQAILSRSRREFGERAAERYRTLIKQALLDLANDPRRPGSSARPEIPVDGARTYHLVFSRRRVAGESGRDPRHFLLDRIPREGVIEVGRVLHESRDLSRHLPATYGRAECP